MTELCAWINPAYVCERRQAKFHLAVYPYLKWTKWRGDEKLTALSFK
jgi:hypothetical protein